MGRALQDCGDEGVELGLLTLFLAVAWRNSCYKKESEDT